MRRPKPFSPSPGGRQNKCNVNKIHRGSGSTDTRAPARTIPAILLLAIPLGGRVRHGLAQSLGGRYRSIMALGGPDSDLLDTGRGVRDWTCFRRPLAKIRPLRLVIAEAVGHRLMHHINDARSRDE